MGPIRPARVGGYARLRRFSPYAMATPLRSERGRCNPLVSRAPRLTRPRPTRKRRPWRPMRQRPARRRRRAASARRRASCCSSSCSPILLRSFVVAPFSIPSGSMMPRLMIGDYLFVAKWPYGYSRYSIPSPRLVRAGVWAAAAERGDVVLFRIRSERGLGQRLSASRATGCRCGAASSSQRRSGAEGQDRRLADAGHPQQPVPLRRRHPGRAWNRAFKVCRYRAPGTLPGGRSYEVLDQVDGRADDTPVYVVPAVHYFMMGVQSGRQQRQRSAWSRGRRCCGTMSWAGADGVLSPPTARPEWISLDLGPAARW